MINTDKVIWHYTDCFGNEIPECETSYKYTATYKVFLFEGDKEDTYRDDNSLEMEITDNEYGVTFNGED